MEKIVVPTVDTIIEKDGKIVLVTFTKEPYVGKLALPGGKIDFCESGEQAAIRETAEETGLKIEFEDLEQFGFYSESNRDERQRKDGKQRVSMVYIAKKFSGELKAGSDAANVKYYDPKDLTKDQMVADHFIIVGDYLNSKE